VLTSSVSAVIRRLHAPVLLAVAALCAGLLTTSSPASAASCGRASGCTKYELIHAGSTYGWWPEAKRFEFKSAQGKTPPAPWHATGRPLLWGSGSLGNGTLIVKTGVDGGDVWSDWRWPRVNGRWEVRYRTLSRRDAAETTIEIEQPDGSTTVEPLTDYKSRLELVPAGTPAQRCTPTSILMAGFDPAEVRVAVIGLTTPGVSYAGKVTAWSQLGDLNHRGSWTGPSNTKKQAWHVWGIELKPKVISWFLDGKVIRRAPRPASIRSTAFSFRAGLLGAASPQVHTAASTSQMDWARYWTLKHTTKNKAKKRALKRAPLLPATRATAIGPC
jgi:hypothetical protein